MVKIYCVVCKKKCKGNVLKVENTYLHRECFQCKLCRKNLEKGGFFQKEGAFYCPDDYQKSFGTRCGVCNEYAVGEVVTVLGTNFHIACFHCRGCKSTFRTGDKATLWNGAYLCTVCFDKRQGKVTIEDQQAPGDENRKPFIDNQSEIKHRRNGETGGVSHPSVIFPEPPGSGSRITTHNVPSTADSEGFSTDSVIETPRHQRCYYSQPSPFMTASSGEDSPRPHTTLGHTPANGTAALSTPSNATTNQHLRRRHRSAGLCDPKNTNDFGRFYVRSYLQLESDSEVACQHSPRDRYRRSGLATPTASSTYAPSSPSVNNSWVKSPHFHRPTDRPFSYRSTRLTPTTKARSGVSALAQSCNITQRLNNTMQMRNGPRSVSMSVTGPLTGHNSHHPHSHPHSHSHPPHPHQPHVNYGHHTNGIVIPLPSHPPCEQDCPESVEPRRLALYPGGHEPKRDEPPAIERQDWPAPPSPAVMLIERFRQKCSSLPPPETDRCQSSSTLGPSVADSVEQCSIISTVNDKERKQLETLVATASKSGLAQALIEDFSNHGGWNRPRSPELDPVSASRTPSANHEPVYKPRYERHVFASPSRDNRRDRTELHSLCSPMYYSFTGGRWRNLPSCPATPRQGFGSRSIDGAGVGLHSTMPPPVTGTSSSLLQSSWLHSVRAASMPQPRGGVEGDSSDMYDDQLRDLTTSPLLGVVYRGGENDSQDRYFPHYDTSGFSNQEGAGSPRTVRTLSMATLSAGDSLLPLASVYYPPSVQSWLRPTPTYPFTVYKPPVKMYTYDQLKDRNKLPRDVDPALLEEHLSTEEFESTFQMSREMFAHLPLWKQNDMKRRVGLY